jgi:hypothetical protein
VNPANIGCVEQIHVSDGIVVGDSIDRDLP